MKKLYFLVISAFSGITLNAQVLTQSNHAPVAGDSYAMYQQDSLIITPGASGTSVVWNFSAATRTSIPLTSSCSASTNTMYPVGAVARTTGTTAANYYTSTSNQLNFWGGNFKVLSFSVDYFFASPAIHAAYAMAYNSSTTSVFTGSLQSGTNNGSISGGTSTVTVDGSGTLSLPTRTFSNVVRVNTYTGFNFSLPLLGASGNVKQQSWDYYSSLSSYPSTKYAPLAQIITNTVTVNLSFPTPTTIVNSSTLALINKDYQYVGITENNAEVSELVIFPNPANTNFNLVFVNEKAEQASFEISNMLGQLIRRENLANTKGVISHSADISGIETGVYFIKVNVGDRSSVKKITIQ